MIVNAINPGAKMGMMDAYEYDYDKVDDIVEELHGRVGAPSRVNLTSLLSRGKVHVGISVDAHTFFSLLSFIPYTNFIVVRPSVRV